MNRISPARRVALALTMLGALAATGACTSSAPKPHAPQPTCVFYDKTARTAARDVGVPSTTSVPTTGTATMTMRTDLGTVTISVDRAKAPCSALSFGYLAGRRYFDGGTCNRLTTEGIFTLTCGDPKGTALGTGPTYGFDEHGGALPSPGAPVTYPRGTVALVNQGVPHSDGAEFFIVYKDSTLPAGAYPVVGTVTSGMSIVDKIAKSGVHPTNADASTTDGPSKTVLTVTSLTLS